MSAGDCNIQRGLPQIRNSYSEVAMNRNAYYASECRAAVLEYRQSAVRYRDSEILRPCYLQLAWKNRRQAREYALKAA